MRRKNVNKRAIDSLVKESKSQLKISSKKIVRKRITKHVRVEESVYLKVKSLSEENKVTISKTVTKMIEDSIQ